MIQQSHSWARKKKICKGEITILKKKIYMQKQNKQTNKKNKQKTSVEG